MREESPDITGLTRVFVRSTEWSPESHGASQVSPGGPPSETADIRPPHPSLILGMTYDSSHNL